MGEYEDKTGATFTVDGRPLLQLMQDDWEIRKAVSYQHIVLKNIIQNIFTSFKHNNIFKKLEVLNIQKEIIQDSPCNKQFMTKLTYTNNISE